MFSRYFLVLCVVAMFAFAMSANAAEEPEQNVEERANAAAKVVQQIIKAAVKWAAKNCISEAADNCKQYWKNPKEALNCGINFLNANKGRCAIGK